MKFNYKLNLVIGGKKITFRTLYPNDVSNSYINSLKEECKYIQNIPKNIDIEKQKKYIQELLLSPSNTICGLFSGKRLIGTAGIQNLFGNDLVEVVDGYTKNCTVGILVLSKASRGKGYGKLLVWTSCILAHYCYGTSIFEACMNITNVPSLKSFLVCGFDIIKENGKSFNVAINFDNLIRPRFIDNVIVSID